MAVTQVYCRTRFIGFHKWTGAPVSVGHLCVPHRHEFWVEASVFVGHADRDVEFQTLRKVVDGYIYKGSKRNPLTLANTWDTAYELSCEMLAAKIAKDLHHDGYKVAYVDVSEDGENGARYIP